MSSVAATRREFVVQWELPQPFDTDALLDFLCRRVVTGVETIVGSTYARTLRLPRGSAEMHLELAGHHGVARFALTDPADLEEAVRRCGWLLDIETDLAVVEARLSADQHLTGSVAAHPGLRVPGHVDGFEVAVRAVVGQQISVAGARTVLGRLVAEYGDPVVGSAGLAYLFPSAHVMAGADPERLPMPRARGRALVGLAAAVAAGRVVLDRTVALTEARQALLGLPGIGPWTADYIALRALGDPDVFMATDLGVRHGLVRLGLGDAGSEVIEGWSPWRSYALMHVWKSLDAEPS